MKWFLIVCAAVLAPTTSAFPQDDSMPTHVLADRVMIGSEFIPRCDPALPSTLIIQKGQISEPPIEAIYGCIEVAGIQRYSRTHDTKLSFTTRIVLPGGYVDEGIPPAAKADQAGDCIPPSVHITNILRDEPIDTTKDPFQWTHGDVNFGRHDKCGAAKLEWTTLAGSVNKGATSITITDRPGGWLVGDELLLPDSLSSIRRESPVFITAIAINDHVITLSKPLDFEHEDIVRPDGQFLLHPRVANLTRNIVTRSENPKGTPGHIAEIGHDASWHIAYSETDGNGRTKNKPLDNTTSDGKTHIGTNQIARYGGDHAHHVMMGLGSFWHGNVFRGTGVNGAKWGLVVHASHDIVSKRNIAIDFSGAGFITEDGYETRTTFDHDFAAYNIGNDLGEESNENQHCPGCSGNGGWWRSRNLSTIIGFEAWNNTIGMNDFGLSQIASNYPSKPGGMADTPLNREATVPILVSDNVAVANKSMCFDSWGLVRYANINLIAAHCPLMQFHVGISNPTLADLVNPQLVGAPGDQFGLFASVAYVHGLEVHGGYIGGNRYAMPDAGAIEYVVYDNVTLQNEKNFVIPDPSRKMDVKVHWKALGNKPIHRIEFGKTNPLWEGTGPLPYTAGVDPWVIYGQGGSRWTYTDLDTGKHYVLFVPQQRGTLPAWPSQPEKPNDQHIYNCPEAGLTNLECWTKYGMSYGGDVVDDAQAVAIDGLSIGFAREGDPTPIGPPRAVVTSPTLRDDASGSFVDAYGEKWLRIWIQLTGDGSEFSDVMVHVDGGPWEKINANRYEFFPGVRQWSVHGNAIKPGEHVIETKRVNARGNATAPMAFTYRVGEIAAPR